MNRLAILALSLANVTGAVLADSPAMAFWNGYDARREPLNVEVVKDWDDAAGQYQLVRYSLGKLAGSNKTASPIIAAYYGYPKGAG